jgi:hypothetical protein
MFKFLIIISRQRLASPLERALLTEAAVQRQEKSGHLAVVIQ